MSFVIGSPLKISLTDVWQRALANQPWKEYTTPDGRKYWNNTETKQSVWEMPREYKDALELNVPPPRPAAPYVSALDLRSGHEGFANTSAEHLSLVAAGQASLNILPTLETAKNTHFPIDPSMRGHPATKIPWTATEVLRSSHKTSQTTHHSRRLKLLS